MGGPSIEKYQRCDPRYYNMCLGCQIKTDNQKVQHERRSPLSVGQ